MRKLQKENFEDQKEKLIILASQTTRLIFSKHLVEAGSCRVIETKEQVLKALKLQGLNL
uniref:Uncharacterized protein n=1 Tax=Arundo donax TaxID=35708 RepID=A0A0A9H2P1_ARUDO